MAGIIKTGEGGLINFKPMSEAAINAAGGVLEGTTGTFNENGFVPGADAWISFDLTDTNFFPAGTEAALEAQGQLSVSVSVGALANPDNRGASNQLSGSRSTKDSGSGLNYLYEFSNNGLIVQNAAWNTGSSTAFVLKDSIFGNGNVARMQSSGKNPFVKMTTDWTGGGTDLISLRADGSPIVEDSAIVVFPTGQFDDLYVGARNTGADSMGSQIDGVVITEIILASDKVTLSAVPVWTDFAGWGDSTALNALKFLSDGVFFDSGLRGKFRGLLAVDGIGSTLSADAEVAGYPGYTVCDTGASDLNDEIDNFAAVGFPTVVAWGGINDGYATLPQITSGTTGTDVRAREYIDKMVAGGTEQIIWIGPGSQDTNVDDLALQPTELAAVKAALRSAISYAASTYPTLKFVYVDSDALLDPLNTTHYVGTNQFVGNVGMGGSVAGTGTYTDVHYNGGQALLIADGYSQIKNYVFPVGSPTLTTPYSDRQNKIGDVIGSTDFTSNITGATSYTSTGFPAGLNVTDLSAVSGTIASSGNHLCAVDGSNYDNAVGGSVGGAFTWSVTPYEATVMSSQVYPIANASDVLVRREDGTGISGSGFGHNFIEMQFYSDEGITPADKPTAGTIVPEIKMQGSTVWQDPAAEGDYRYSFSGKPADMRITIAGITGDPTHFRVSLISLEN